MGSWSSGADAAEVLTEVHAAVVDGFALADSGNINCAMTYPDDEGDECTLVESTVKDFLGAAKTGVLRLLIKTQGSSEREGFGGAPLISSAGESLGFLAAQPAVEPQECSISTPRGQAPAT